MTTASQRLLAALLPTKVRQDLKRDFKKFIPELRDPDKDDLLLVFTQEDAKQVLSKLKKLGWSKDSSKGSKQGWKKNGEWPILIEKLRSSRIHLFRHLGVVPGDFLLVVPSNDAADYIGVLENMAKKLKYEFGFKIDPVLKDTINFTHHVYDSPEDAFAALDLLGANAKKAGLKLKPVRKVGPAMYEYRMHTSDWEGRMTSISASDGSASVAGYLRYLPYGPV